MMKLGFTAFGVILFLMVSGGPDDPIKTKTLVLALAWAVFVYLMCYVIDRIQDRAKRRS